MAHYLIIGNGIAGTTAAEHIRKQDDKGSITIVADEGLAFYNRMKLNELISGEMPEQKLMMKKDEWYREQRIDLKLKTRIEGAEPGEKVLITKDNKKLPYDRLLIAAGSHSFIPPMKGATRRGFSRFVLSRMPGTSALGRREFTMWFSSGEVSSASRQGMPCESWERRSRLSNFFQGFYQGNSMGMAQRGFRLSWRAWGFPSDWARRRRRLWERGR